MTAFDAIKFAPATFWERPRNSVRQERTFLSLKMADLVPMELLNLFFALTTKKCVLIFGGTFFG